MTFNFFQEGFQVTIAGALQRLISDSNVRKKRNHVGACTS